MFLRYIFCNFPTQHTHGRDTIYSEMYKTEQADKENKSSLQNLMVLKGSQCSSLEKTRYLPFPKQMWTVFSLTFQSGEKVTVPNARSCSRSGCPMRLHSSSLHKHQQPGSCPCTWCVLAPGECILFSPQVRARRARFSQGSARCLASSLC